MSKVYLVKNKAIREIGVQLAIDLMRHYTIAGGGTYNQYGQVIYLRSKDRKRTHSILIGKYKIAFNKTAGDQGLYHIKDIRNDAGELIAERVSDANAPLIAAAPEMLIALKYIESQMRYDDTGWGFA